MPKVIFKNKPTLSVHEADKNFNERRLNFISNVNDFISNNELFKNENEVTVTFLEGGVSSLICLLNTSNQKLILKIPLSRNFSRGEGQFLKIWEQAGVTVPHIIEEGRFLDEHSYVIYNYINAKVLGNAHNNQELLEKKTFIEMGRILKRMHVPKIKGYGHVIDEKPEYASFKEWLNSPELKKKIAYVQENKLLDETHGSLSDAFDILTAFTDKENESSYCHDDFYIHNIFDTDPLTIFDPNPRFNHGYVDLARTIFAAIWHGERIDEIVSQLIEGYFEGEPYNKKALQSAVLLYSYMKLPYSHQTNKIDKVKNVQEYLSKILQNSKLN